MMNTWMKCPLQARFKEVEGLVGKQGSKAAFGTCMHAALDHYQRTKDLDETIRLFLHLWDNPETIGVAVETWNRYTTFGGLRQRGIEILRAYDAANRWDDRTVICSEHQFLVPFGRHELTGTVDLIDLRRNHKGKDLLRICDYKVNARRPNIGELALNIQFTTYMYAITQPEFWLGNGDFPAVVNGEWWWETLKDVPRRGIWVQLWDNGKEIDAGTRDQRDYDRLYTLCNEIERAVEANVYVPDISGESCSLCDFANGPCPTRVPTRDEWQAERLESEVSWL